MNTYVLQVYYYTAKGTQYEHMRASNLDNLRKNAIAKYKNESVAIEVTQTTELNKLNFRGTLDIQKGVAHWQTANKNKWSIVDPATGKLR